MYVSMCVYFCMYVCMYVCMHVFTPVCMHVCMSGAGKESKYLQMPIELLTCTTCAGTYVSACTCRAFCRYVCM